MNLIDRIDIALQRKAKSRADLAEHIGVSVQAISNLKRRPKGTLRPENVARAARFLECDLYWLCTGEGGDYVKEHQQSWFAREVAAWLDAMPESKRDKAFVLIYAMQRDHWPRVVEEKANNGHESTHHA